jgi:hypothetical protein
MRSAVSLSPIDISVKAAYKVVLSRLSDVMRDSNRIYGMNRRHSRRTAEHLNASHHVTTRHFPPHSRENTGD